MLIVSTFICHTVVVCTIENSSLHAFRQRSSRGVERNANLTTKQSLSAGRICAEGPDHNCHGVQEKEVITGSLTVESTSEWHRSGLFRILRKNVAMKELNEASGKSEADGKTGGGRGKIEAVEKANHIAIG